MRGQWSQTSRPMMCARPIPKGQSRQLDGIDPALFTSLLEASTTIAQTASSLAPQISEARSRRAAVRAEKIASERAYNLERQRIRAQSKAAAAAARAPRYTTIKKGPSTTAVVGFGAVMALGLTAIVLVATRRPSGQHYPAPPGYESRIPRRA